VSPIELAAVLLIGFIGLVCLCILLLAVGAAIIREHRDEARFRQELRLAHRLEAQAQLEAFLAASETLAVEVHRPERARQASWN
jgi:hypothetical protein